MGTQLQPSPPIPRPEQPPPDTEVNMDGVDMDDFIDEPQAATLDRSLYDVLDWSKITAAVLMVGGTVGYKTKSVQAHLCHPGCSHDEWEHYLRLYELQLTYIEARQLPAPLAERLTKAKAAMSKRERTFANTILTRNVVQENSAMEALIKKATPRCQPLLRDLVEHFRSHFANWCPPLPAAD